MTTKIKIHSVNGNIEPSSFTAFVKQAEEYFNKFGHLPNKDVVIEADPGTRESEDIVYLDNIEYSGELDGYFIITFWLDNDILRSNV